MYRHCHSHVNYRSCKIVLNVLTLVVALSQIAIGSYIKQAHLVKYCQNKQTNNMLKVKAG